MFFWRLEKLGNSGSSLEAQIYIYIYRLPVLKSLFEFILSIAQGPTISVPGLLGAHKWVISAATSALNLRVVVYLNRETPI